MEAGIERLSMATKLSSCPSVADGRAARHRMSLQAFSMRTITPGEGRSAWLSIGAADCSSPTMLETRFGECHRIMPVPRPTIDDNRRSTASRPSPPFDVVLTYYCGNRAADLG